MRRPEVVSAPCACTTAFACAVVPDVKNTVATSVGETVRLERVEERVVGRRRERRASARRRACRVAAPEQQDHAAERGQRRRRGAVPARPSSSSGTSRAQVAR